MSKDGPSAGVAITVALVSLLTGRRVRGDVAMTGEITLRGTVLPVGGIKEKVLAAHRAGIKRVVLPERNRKDIVDIPETIRQELELVFVKKIDEVLELTLETVPVVVPGPDAPGTRLRSDRPRVTPAASDAARGDFQRAAKRHILRACAPLPVSPSWLWLQSVRVNPGAERRPQRPPPPRPRRHRRRPPSRCSIDWAASPPSKRSSTSS